MSTDEQTLVRRSQAGDEAAFGKLVERYHGRMYAVLYRLLGEREDARDGCQEVFWRAWQGLRQFDADRPLQPWLDRIATNYAYDRLRQRRSRPQPTSDEALAHLADERAGPEAGLLQQEAATAVGDAIRGLAAEYRIVIVMRHQRGLTYQEIAAELGWPLSLVKNRLMRARRMLRAQLDPIRPQGRHEHAVQR